MRCQLFFMVSFSPTSKAADIGDSNSANVKDDGHSIKKLALLQTKRVKEQINRLGPCKAWNGTLASTCEKSKKDDSVITGSSKRMTMDQNIYLSDFVKESGENDQISTLISQ